MRRRRLHAPLVAGIAILALAGCGLGSEAPADSDGDSTGGDAASGDGSGELSGEITFTTLQLSPDFDEYIEGVIEDFESQHDGVTVNWVDLPFEGAAERLLADASAGELADVINLNPDLAYPLASDGQFINLDEAAAHVKDDYIEGAWDSFRYPGQEGAYGFPWYLTTETTMYNASILEDAGLDPDSPPQTYEELFDMGMVIAEETGMNVIHPALEDRLVIDLRKRGVEIANEDLTQATFNTQMAVDHVTALRDLHEAGGISSDAVTQEHRHEIDAYQAGQLATFMRGPNFINIVAENAPDIAEVTVPGPQIRGEAQMTGMSVMGLFVPESTDNRDLAIEFAAFMTNGENQIGFAEFTPVFPSIESALQEDSFLPDEDDDSAVAEATRIAAEQLPNAENIRPVYVDEEVNQALIQNVQGAILGQLTPEEALDAAEDEVNQILERRSNR
ncbi:MAG TPA: sugar ABC transporter substrate-binding protein [Beutenbergiaceae bacterium]|nr:sugar ABC transporter substrate-binding protein [Beutenbergiaceae bacterium]